jgi:hypothetical protein
VAASKPRIVRVHGAMHGGWCFSAPAELAGLIEAIAEGVRLA